MVLLICASTGGCYGTVGYSYGYNGPYGYPDMAYVAPGVYAVTNWDVPIFYSGNYFWMYDAGNWYRSPYYTHGWVHAYPTRAIAGVYQPWTYVRWRPPYYPSYRYPYHYGYRSYPYYGRPRYYGLPRPPPRATARR